MLAPMVENRKGEYAGTCSGTCEARPSARPHRRHGLPLDGSAELDKKLKHDIEVVVDRLVVRADVKTRLADSLRRRCS